MKMRKFGILLGLVFFTAISFAQNCDTYIPWETGKKITTESYDEKGKLTGSSTNQVLSITELPGKTEAVVEVENFDKKGVSTGKGQLKYYCTGDVFEIDMKSMLPQDQMAGFEGMTIEYKMENMAYPKAMVAGMTIKDGFVEAVISNEGMTFMTMRTDITNIKVEAIESVTVPAGTYTAYKISSDVAVKTGFMTVNMKSVQWMVVGLGAVRTESYNKKGALVAYSVISKVE